MKKLLLLFIILTTITLPAGADVAISSDAAIVIEAQTGQVLSEKDGAKKILPGNTAKIMTALVALENGSLEDILTIEAEDGVLQAGERVSLKEALSVMLLKSSNECAKAIAKHISDKEFTKLMNEKAKSLGVLNTVFDNPAGGKNEEYTTAYDMAIITKKALENPDFAEIFTSKSVKIGENKKTVSSNIEMLASGNRFYEFATGGITSNSAELGNTIVVTAKKGMLELIVVLLDSGNTKYADSEKLFDNAFANYYKIKVEPTAFQLPTSKATGAFGKRALITFSAPEELLLVLPEGISIEQLTFTNDIKPKYREAKTYEAGLTITADGAKTIIIPLSASQDKMTTTVWTVIIIILLVIAAIILIILSIAAYYIISANLKKRKRHGGKSEHAFKIKKKM